MLRDAVRGVVVVAAGIAEEAGRRVVGAASDLLERSGVDVAAVEKRVGEQLPPSVKSLQILATEAVTVGRAGVDLAVGVARGEVERVFERVGDQMVKVGVVLSYLEGRLRSVDEEEEPPAPRAGAKPANRADGLFDAGWDDDDVPEPVHFAPDTAPATAPDGTAEPAGTAEPDTGTEPQREKPAAARPAAAKKPPAKRAPAKKTAAQPSAAKKGAAKKTTAKKTTTRKATAKRTVAQPPTAKKAATKKTVVKKTVTRRPAPKEDGGA